jgi:hypothetical protein
MDTFLGHERRIGGHAVKNAQCIGFADLVEVGGVDEEFHRVNGAAKIPVTSTLFAHSPHAINLHHAFPVLSADPFGENSTKRGILILDAGDIEVAKPWVEADSMVKA